MSITDELRTSGIYLPASNRRYFTEEELTAIADRIDAEHERAVASVMNDALYHANEKDMAEFGWIRLPKGADGKYIHMGDKMECFTPQHPDVPKVFEVQRILMDDVTGCRLVAYPATYVPEECRHYHEPTVEDVLREFTDEVWNRCCEGATASDSGIDELVAECAAKLRLADDKEE